MPDYTPIERLAFEAILANMDRMGWDLAAGHAHLVMNCLRGDRPPTLAEELTTKRYLDALGYQGPCDWQTRA